MRKRKTRFAPAKVDTSTKIYVFDPRKGKDVVLGTIKDDTLYRTVRRSHHIRFCDCYGIQEDAFRNLITLGVKRIRFRTPDKVLMFDMRQRGIVLRDLGHGPQYLLPRYLMEEIS